MCNDVYFETRRSIDFVSIYLMYKQISFRSKNNFEGRYFVTNNIKLKYNNIENKKTHLQDVSWTVK